MNALIAPATVRSIAWEAGRTLESLSTNIEAAESIAFMLAQSDPLDERTQLAFMGLAELLGGIRKRMGVQEEMFDTAARAAGEPAGEAV